MDVTNQAAVPYQFFQGEYSGGVHSLSWPDEFQGIVTDITMSSGGDGGVPGVYLIDASDVPYARALGTEVGSSGVWLGQWSGFQSIPSGSELQIAVAGNSVQMAISGWLLNPPGSVIIPE